LKNKFDNKVFNFYVVLCARKTVLITVYTTVLWCNISNCLCFYSAHHYQVVIMIIMEVLSTRYNGILNIYLLLLHVSAMETVFRQLVIHKVRNVQSCHHNIISHT
jgi:hypothetical protein